MKASDIAASQRLAEAHVEGREPEQASAQQKEQNVEHIEGLPLEGRIAPYTIKMRYVFAGHRISFSLEQLVILPRLCSMAFTHIIACSNAPALSIGREGI